MPLSRYPGPKQFSCLIVASHTVSLVARTTNRAIYHVSLSFRERMYVGPHFFEQAIECRFRAA
jgi:mannose-1-phosphate guanylyltransferase